MTIESDSAIWDLQKYLDQSKSYDSSQHAKI